MSWIDQNLEKGFKNEAETIGEDDFPDEDEDEDL